MAKKFFSLLLPLYDNIGEKFLFFISDSESESNSESESESAIFAIHFMALLSFAIHFIALPSFANHSIALPSIYNQAMKKLYQVGKVFRHQLLKQVVPEFLQRVVAFLFDSYLQKMVISHRH